MTALQSTVHPQSNAFQQDSKLEPGREFVLTPILVVGLGRSGTTLMMEHLARDPRVLFNRTFPFEVRVLSTLAKFCQTFPRVPLYGVALNMVLWQGGVKEESNYCIAAGEQSSDLKFEDKQLLLTQWKEISKTSLENNAEAKFYAEKCWNWLPLFLHGSLPAHSIFIFRDPKDTFLSAHSFSKKAQCEMIDDNSRYDEGTEGLNFMYQALLYFETYQWLRNKSSVTCVRYEDLVNKTDETLGQLKEQFGFHCTSELDVGLYDSHKTSADAKSSIGRWKSEPIADADLFYLDCVAPDMLKQLDYEPGRSMDLDLGLTRRFTENDRASHLTADADFFLSEESGLHLQVTGPQPALIVKGFTRHDVREIWLSRTANPLSPLTLRWRENGQDFSTDRQVLGFEFKSEACSIARFAVHSHPLWKGDFCELEITGWMNDCDQPGKITSCRWIRLIPPVPKQYSQTKKTSTIADVLREAFQKARKRLATKTI